MSGVRVELETATDRVIVVVETEAAGDAAHGGPGVGTVARLLPIASAAAIDTLTGRTS